MQAFAHVAANAEWAQRTLATPELAEDWTTTMSRRLSNLCRACQQVSSSKKPPSWIMRLPWIAADPGAIVVADASPNPSSSAVDASQWFYGWSLEHEKAYRQKDEATLPQFAVKLREPASGQLEDSMLAEFVDGTTVPTPGRAVHDHRASLQAQESKVGQFDWRSSHKMTQNGAGLT